MSLVELVGAWFNMDSDDDPPELRTSVLPTSWVIVIDASEDEL